MVLIAAVQFKKNSKNYFFKINDLEVKSGQHVIVETEKGLQYGKVSLIKEIADEDIGTPLKSIIRIATEKDEKQHQSNLKESDEALNVARKKADELKLSMRIIDATFTFDKK